MSKKMNILFVDDEPRILQGLRRTLYSMRSQWEMSFALGAQQAIDLLHKQEFDVIVSDIRMPGMDGVKLLNLVKEEFPGMIRFALSGQTSKESILKSIGPIHQYISKPCNVDDLTSKINHIHSIRMMFENPELYKIITQLEALPCISSIYTLLITKLRSEDASIKDIANIISQDMGMSVKILQIVNSALYGLRQNVSNISEAVKYLGLETISSLVLFVKIFAQFCVNIDENSSMDELWKHSLKVSKYVRTIVTDDEVEKNLADDAVIAGMLHDVGKLVLMAKLPDKYEKVIALSRQKNITSLEAELQIIGTGHNIVGPYLLGLWGFDNPIIEALRFHHEPTLIESDDIKTLTYVHIADCFANVNLNEYDTVEKIPSLNIDYLQNTGIFHKLNHWKNILSPETCLA